MVVLFSPPMELSTRSCVAKWWYMMESVVFNGKWAFFLVYQHQLTVSCF